MKHKVTRLDYCYPITRFAEHSECFSHGAINRYLVGAISRREYEETLKSLQERKTQLKSVGELLNRFEAQPTGTNNAVDNVVTNIISLKGRSAEDVKEKVPA